MWGHTDKSWATLGGGVTLRGGVTMTGGVTLRAGGLPAWEEYTEGSRTEGSWYTLMLAVSY